MANSAVIKTRFLSFSLRVFHSTVMFWSLTFDVWGEGGEPTKRSTARDRKTKVSELCLFAIWDWCDNWDLFHLLKVSFVGFPN